MQNIVNAQCVIDKIVYYFGEDSVQTCDAGIVKLHVKELSNDVKYITDCLVYANVQIKRSGKGLIVLFIPRIDEGIYTPEMSNAINKTWDYALKNEATEASKKGKVFKTLRDFYEFCLQQEDRMTAFELTAKNKLDVEFTDFTVAMCEAFDWGKTPQGYDYWERLVNYYFDKD